MSLALERCFLMLSRGGVKLPSWARAKAGERKSVARRVSASAIGARTLGLSGFTALSLLKWMLLPICTGVVPSSLSKNRHVDEP